MNAIVVLLIYDDIANISFSILLLLYGTCFFLMLHKRL